MLQMYRVGTSLVLRCPPRLELGDEAIRAVLEEVDCTADHLLPGLVDEGWGRRLSRQEGGSDLGQRSVFRVQRCASSSLTGGSGQGQGERARSDSDLPFPVTELRAGGRDASDRHP